MMVRATVSPPTPESKIPIGELLVIFMVSPVFWVSFWLRVSPIVLPIMV